MKPLILIAFFSLAAASAQAQDDVDASVLAINAAKSKWTAAGAQTAATRGAAGEATTEQILSEWSRECPAIAVFRASKGAPSAKRGVSIVTRVPNAATIIDNLRPYWYYTWVTAPVPNASSEFVPMIYGIDNIENNLRELNQLLLIPRFVLGYNEPDIISHHISPVDGTWALSYAPRLPPGTAAVSPASSWVNQWFDDFVKSDVSRQFDYIAIHLYENIQDNDPASIDRAVVDFKRRLTIAAAAKKPVWVTEFGLATWRTATKDHPAKFTSEQAACYMAQIVPYLEEHSMRYSWFSPAREEASLYATLPDALWNRDGSLTPLGELYRQ